MVMYSNYKYVLLIKKKQQQQQQHYSIYDVPIFEIQMIINYVNIIFKKINYIRMFYKLQCLSE